MSASPEAGPGRVGELRREFDRTFAEPPRTGRGDTEDVLAIRIAGAAYALRVSEIRSVHRDCRWTAAPGRHPGFLGLTGVRGEAVPVYSLGTLLGAAVADASPRWLVLCGGAARIGMAFDGFEGFRRIAATAVSPAPPDRAGRGIRDVADIDGTARPVIDLKAVSEPLF
jgi:purine-binding chemotaxis protein CheW